MDILKMQHVILYYPKDIEGEPSHLQYVSELNRNGSIHILSPFKEHAYRFRSIKVLDKVLRKPYDFHWEYYNPITIPYCLAPDSLLDYKSEYMVKKYGFGRKFNLITRTPYKLYKLED